MIIEKKQVMVSISAQKYSIPQPSNENRAFRVISSYVRNKIINNVYDHAIMNIRRPGEQGDGNLINYLGLNANFGSVNEPIEKKTKRNER